MAKTLIVLCDGTWNSGDDAAPSNVSRLYRAILDAGIATQRAQYLHGVGRGWSSLIGRSWTVFNSLTGGILDPVFGGASGWGLSRQVREGYRFLVQEYEPGDEIFVFGFSRGAFAARSLVGLIKHAGLLKRQAEPLIRGVTKAYHRLLRNRKHRAFLESDRNRTHGNVRVKFVGVWDTVGALGVPIWGGDFSLNPLPLLPRFHDVNPWDIVDEVHHAVAIDEQRAAYLPVLLNVCPGMQSLHFDQVWFRGVHSDIGGGYVESELADATFSWMLTRAIAAGLYVSDVSRQQVSNSSMRATLHDSLGSFWLAGVWPRWFPIAQSPQGSDYDPMWGYMHDSVMSHFLEKHKGGWLIDLGPEEATGPIDILASAYWTNTRVIMRKGARYRLEAQGTRRVGSIECGTEGYAQTSPRARSNLRLPKARLGELVGLINAPLRERPSGRLWDALRYLLTADPHQFTDVLESCGTSHKEDGSCTIVAARTGVFHCFANSQWTRQKKNEGSIHLIIRRLG